jgi:hypothetical protein
MTALSKKALVLNTYAYLRDAKAKSFYHESMTENLWSTMADLQNRLNNALDTKNKPGSRGGSTGGGDAAKARAPKCSHCRSTKLHDQLKLKPGKTHCPLEDQPAAKARKVASATVKAFEAEPA